MGTKKPQPGYYSGTKKSASTSTSANSILLWILLGITSLFLFWAPFQKALFNGNFSSFEGPIFSSLVWTCIIFFLLSVFLFYHWKLQTQADLLTIAVWLIPISYLISTFSAASSTLAFNLFYIQIIYVAFFLLAYYISNAKFGLTFLKYLLIASAYVIVAFGLLNWLGQKEGVFRLVKWFAADMGLLKYYEHAVMEDSNGPRLTSVFQYANTYAGYLIAILLCAVHMLMTSKRWYTIALHALFVVPIIISFFVTLSRGALVVLPVIVLLVLPFLKLYKQVTYLLHLLISFVLSFIILNQVTTVGVQLFKTYDSQTALSAWTSLILCSLGYTVLAVLIQLFVEPWLQRKLDKLQSKRFSHIGLPLIVVVAGTIGAMLLLNDTGVTKMLPENIRTRIENINFQQHSVLERGTFYKDAIKVFEDYPVFGAGGGAWSSLYEKYQNNPYTSRQAHNFYLQYLVETGIVGGIIFILILLSIFYIYIRNYLRQNEEEREHRFIFYIIAIGLLVHSALDFDLSFVYLGLLLFLCMGAMVSSDTSEVKAAWLQTLGTKKWAFPSILVVLSFILFFNAVQLVSANRNYTTTKNLLASGNTDFNQLIAPLNLALEQRPTQPEYVLQKVAILFQVYSQSKDENYYKEAVSLIDQARKKEPFDYFLIERKIQSYLLKDNQQEALNLASEQIDNFPWKVALYEKAIDLATRLGAQAFEKRDQQSQEQYWSKAIELYHRFESQKQALASLPKEQLQGNEFSLTPQMGFSLGQIYYLQKKYPESENMLRIGVGDNLADAFTRQNTRWYLAALQKQGKNDQAVYDKLVAADPNEKNEVQFLVNLK
ncbi:O-antigen ligase family protein [Paenibacillus sp. tmac-D7]|uniref:O-antigen ligase family protein n=1 Tax=Paenibacillus sp. tmac-D7 TaxID=2591462 RepID=UPI00114185E8|nr:O-antigen ligase family protein [Paenibacillus sp. tmac-D7]